MNTLRFDISKSAGAFKIMNATNGGPIHKRHNPSQYRSNLETYKAARMPYSRNHDSAMCGIYGGPYSHDISCIFPNFDADVNDPASYDFACTDESILVCLEAGTKTFFRLGQTIEHQIKKHHVYPPKDYQKWAEICEHIIRHYTEGWADGFTHDMPYWEIWTEPDLGEGEDIHTRKTWAGTREQFYDFYEVVAKHLKKCFPHLKIGGPALANRVLWADSFLAEMQKREVPIDFFSWHIYYHSTSLFIERADAIRTLLDKYGYENAESILDEYNYVHNWREGFVNSLEMIHGIKGASFVMACISEGQKSSIDMMMYYDTRPSAFNGAFDFYTLRPLKGYYPLYWYGMFYDMKNEVRTEDSIDNIHTLCGVDENDKVLSVITYYIHEYETAENKEVKIDFGREGEYEIYLLDENHDAELIKTTSDLTFTMTPCSCIMIKEK